MEPYEEPRSRRGWLLGAVVVVVFAIFGAIVGYAWFEGLPGGGGEPPLIRAEVEPYRRAPNERGGLTVANTSSSIVSVLRPQSEAPRVERLLPPETPMALEAAAPELPPDGEAEESAPAPTSPEPVTAASASTTATPEPATDVSPPAQPSAPLGDETRAAALEPDAAPAPVKPAAAAPVPLPRPVRPQPAPAREPAAARDIGNLIAALPSPASPPPPARQRAAAPPEPPARARTQPPPAIPPRLDAPEPPVRVAAAPAPALLQPQAGATAAGAGVYRLQLTAVRSETGLTQAWAQLRQRYPILGGVAPKVERTDTSSGPLFRLQAGPFQSREAAANACGAIRSGGGQCFIVGPIAP